MHDADGQLSIGSSAPLFTLPGVEGRLYRLADYRGKARGVCVIFSCNHCPYVIKAEDRIIALGREYQPRGVQFLLVCSNDAVKYPADSFDNMKRRARDKNYPFPYLHDESQQTARAFGALVTPHVFLLDSELILRYRGAVDDNVDNPAAVKRHYLRDALDALMDGDPGRIDPPSTRAVGCSVKWK